MIDQSEFVGGHNVKFDLNIIGAEFFRMGQKNSLEKVSIIDTCTDQTASLCKLPGGRGGKFKLPTLSELHHYLFGIDFQEVHNATADVEATTRCFFELFRKGLIQPETLKNQTNILNNLKEVLKLPVQGIGLNHQNLKKASLKLAMSNIKEEIPREFNESDETLLNQSIFNHLHTHSQFSVLQSTSRINDLIKTASNDGMSALTLTDHANMMGAFHFIKAIKKHNSDLEDGKQGLKAILGCEFFICDDHKDRSRRDNGYQIIYSSR